MTRKEILRFIFWEWIEPLGSALCIALLVMKFVVALYVIPTGSMQPTLHGKGDYPHELGDKVLVNKFIYRFQRPERWDVIVFDYPFHTIHCNNCGWEEREFPKHLPKVIPKALRCPSFQCIGREKNLSFIEKEYIKRCAAIPGDEISVRDGNVVLKGVGGVWVPSIKTDAAQGALWLDVFDSSEAQSMAVRGMRWQTLPQSEAIEKWKVGRELTLNKGVPTTLLFRHDFAGHGDKGVNGGNSPQNAPPVGDVLLEVQLATKPAKGVLTLEVDRNRLSHRLEVDFEKGSWVAKLGEETLGQGTLPQTMNLGFARLDGRLEVMLEGKRLGFDFGSGELDPTETVLPKIRWSGEVEIAFSRVRVARDIFYVIGPESDHFTGPEMSYKVRSGEYFAMGDNSYFSSDSRKWGPVPAEALIGKALVVILPFQRIKFIR